MLFIIQKEVNEKGLFVETAIIEDLVKNSKFSKHWIITMKNSDFFDNGKLKNKNDFKKEIQNGIPFGTIEFTNNFLKIFHGIEKMNPIEIPKFLRTEEILKRKYNIVSYEDLPKTGRYFVKNVSSLKQGTFSGDIEEMHDCGYFEKDCMYQISEIVNIISEYRVYILNGKIYAIAYYDGNPCVFPDVKLIEKINLMYSILKEYPKSYTMDVMVTDNGTALTEIHTFFSCGIYQSVLGTDFLNGYSDALEYVKKYNNVVEKS